jgi:1,4-alpha-glucan branching enzyme
VDCNDSEASVLTFLRKGRSPGDVVLVACNFTPMPRPGYRVGVPTGGRWRELLNSDATEYGGAGWGNMGGLDAEPLSHHGRPLSLPLTLPPLGAVFLKPEGAEP